MKTIVIAYIKDVYNQNLTDFKAKYHNAINILFALNREELDKIVSRDNIDAIFFLHWPWIIPKRLFNSLPCIVFHTADLPKGRGGSPIQNQISEGIFDSYVCALKVNENLDAGDVYMKIPVSLRGTADEIMIRISCIIFNDMIPRMVFDDIKPKPQQGEPSLYKRREPIQSEINKDMTLERLFSHIQMLDGEGYPHAFVEVNGFRMEFTRASIKNNYVLADVKIERMS